MKTDLYTKVILTVIAVSLSVIAIQNIFPSRTASASHASGFNADGSMNVRVISDMDVNINKIGGSSVYGALPINLKEVSGSSISSYGVPVNIEAVNGSSIYDAIPVKNK